MRLWFYNNVLRHWHNWRYRHLAPTVRAGRITRADMEWARQQLKDTE